MSFTIQLQTSHGEFLMNRNDRHQPMAIVRTGRPHIEREIQLLLGVVGCLPDGAVVVDAGANIGLIAIPLARALEHRGGMVLAFEPQRLIYYMLAGNVALAGLQNCVCHQGALDATEGGIEVPVADPWQEQDFGMVSLAGEVQNGDLVQAVPIDLLALDRLDLIKIDVEGMEGRVLAGAEETIARCRPLIWIEVWPDAYQEIFEWMMSRNYAMFVVDQLNFISIPDERCKDFAFDFPLFDGSVNPFLRADEVD